MSIGKTLLVIEDDADHREAVARVLRDAGHEVLCAATGRDGLKTLHGGACPDLSLLDFWLPDMTGHAFLEAKARWPGGRVFPVPLVTQGYIEKPIRTAQLMSIVGQHVSRAERSILPSAPRRAASELLP